MNEYERRTKRCVFLMQLDKTQGILHDLDYYMRVLEGDEKG